MRVAVLTQQFPTSHHRWAGHSVYQTLRVLARRCDLHVFYPEVTYPSLPSFIDRRSLRRPDFDRSWNPPAVPATYVPYKAFPVISRSLNGLSMARRILPHVRRFDPDVILSYFIYPDGYAAVRIGKMLDVPVVVTAVGSDLNRQRDPICRKLTAYTLRNADFVSTVSQHLCETARTQGADPARSRAKPNGCDTAVFHPMDRQRARRTLELDQDAEIIVYVGRLDVRKGLIELIEAVQKLRAQRPKLRCFIVGSGPDKPRLIEAIATAGMNESISIVPSCATDRVALWMVASNLVTLPSYNEGCPNVVIEALAAGRPVVATNVGGIPELMDETCGRLVPRADVPALTKALQQVLDATWDATAISATHSRSWSDVADELYQILDESRAACAFRECLQPL